MFRSARPDRKRPGRVVNPCTPDRQWLGSASQWFAILVTTIITLLCFALPSRAAVLTIGPTLPIPVSESFTLGCTSPCALTNTAFPAETVAFNASHGLMLGSGDVSPVDGVILRWHLFGATVNYSDFARGEYRLRVFSPLGSSYLGIGTSASSGQVQSEWKVETFATHLPIKAGQVIALELFNRAGLRFHSSPEVTSVFLQPAMADGEISEESSDWNGVNGWVFPFSADVLPAPLVTGMTPPGGPFEEGAKVVLSGENFAEVQDVTVGAQPADFTVNSESEITVRVPPGSPLSSIPVKVFTAAGSAESPPAFSYEACIVPRLKGRTLASANRVVNKANCRLGVTRARAGKNGGRVRRQKPPRGSAIPVGGTVKVTLR